VTRRATLLAAASLVVLLLGAGSARGAIGDLTYQGCISGEMSSSAACALIPSATSLGQDSGLEFPQAVVVSPDGNSVYVAVAQDSAVATFSRNTTTGALTYQGCISGDTALDPECTRIGSHAANGLGSGMGELRALALSPDGAHLYGVAHDDDSVVHFSRDTSTGALTFQSCTTGDTNANGCATDIPEATANGDTSGLNELYDLAVNAENVYVVSQEDDSIARFNRNPGNGTITYDECLTGEFATGLDGTGACDDSPTIKPFGTDSGIDKPRSVTISPDGSSVYVAAPQDDSITRFNRASGGALTYQGCITAEESSGPVPGNGSCSSLTGAALPAGGAQSGMDNPQSIAVSPDNASLYVASGNDASLARFDRAAGGALTYQGCITGELQSGPSPGGTDACAAAPVMTSTGGQPGGSDSGLFNLRDVVVSPDGSSVYASSGDDSSVIRFGRAAGGAIAFVGCVSGDAGSGVCTQIPSSTAFGGDSGMAWVQALAVSPDSTSLYYVAQHDNSVGRFALEQPPIPDQPPAETDTAPPDTTITAAPKKKTKKKQAVFGFSGTDARVVAGFQCSLDGAPFVPCSSPFTTKVKRGKHTFGVRAVDAAGNIDPTPATYDWKVKKKKKKK
jgi:6-phosphogluconolactonase (cycloisomerase 2 family)